MSADIEFRYMFQAIGQGLFGWGALKILEEHRFDWVYDCGTSSSPAFLDRELALYERYLDDRPIGLLCISHFDKDHINGVRLLVTRHRIRTVVLPYVPLVERLLIALETLEPVPVDYLEFLIDPAGYLLAASQGKIDEIIFIAGGGEPPGPNGLPEGESRRPPSDGPDWVLSSPEIPPDPAFAPDDIAATNQHPSGKVRVLSHRQVFSLHRIWEFVFYNINQPDAVLARLRPRVLRIIKKCRNADGTLRGDALLDQLKELYTRTFGSTGDARNKISLVTYSGPIFRPRANLSCAFNIVSTVTNGLGGYGTFYNNCWANSDEGNKVSLLYFGDFSLTTPARLNDLRNHLLLPRWHRLEVIQVPHHGSRNSWYVGAAAEFHHRLSICSSSSTSAFHPFRVVINDLLAHGFMLANELQRVGFRGKIKNP